jgi:hypothetical protein
VWSLAKKVFDALLKQTILETLEYHNEKVLTSGLPWFGRRLLSLSYWF